MATLPKFATGTGSFQQELKLRVNRYFAERKQSPTGNVGLHIKAISFFVVYFALYIHLLFFTPLIWFAIPECLLLGGLTAAIGFNVMHDGSHGSFSKSKWLNKLAAVSVNCFGASAIMWNMKHNIVHHTYTNIDGMDDDIEIQPFLRMSTTQKKLKVHRFQHIYVWFLYSFLLIIWVFATDYIKYFKRRIGAMPLQKLSVKQHITFWAAKVVYAFMMIVFPIYKLGFMAWLVGFLIVVMFAGFVLSVVFQLAHTVEHTAFPMPTDETNKIENEWAIHQVETTANFATKNKLVSWLVGGLNFQIEHHLFPKVSHIHYPAISKIIKQTCADFGITYLEFPRMRHAIASHASYLRRMGREG
jgi:linoleoyl-CoA desaturase